MTETKKPKARRGRVWQRGDAWWLDFGHRGRRYRMPAETAKTERQAWDELEKKRGEARAGRRLDLERARFEHIAERLRERYKAQGTRPRTLKRWEQALGHLEAFFGSDLARDVPDRLEAYVMARRRKEAKPATIKLELGVLAHAFKVSKLPRLELPPIEVRNVRQGFFEPAGVARLVEHLPPALRPVALFGFYTGWRKEEVLSRRWRDVDFKAGTVRLQPGETKNGEGRVFPFAAHPELARLLREQREATTALEKAEGCIVPWVFHRHGEPIRDMDDAWNTACRKAGLHGRTFHDLRRSAALNLRQLGLSESDIMEMGGWLTRAMFKRYCITDETGLAERLRRAMSGAASPKPDPQVILKDSEYRREEGRR